MVRNQKPRDQKTPFTLTPFETELLAEYDSGMSPKDIAAKRGLVCGSVANLYSAIDKRRTAAAWERQQDHAGFTSLSRSHGATRMAGTR